MPTKCIDQMPMPIATPPPMSQAGATLPSGHANAQRERERGVGRQDGDQHGNQDEPVVIMLGHAAAQSLLRPARSSHRVR